MNTAIGRAEHEITLLREYRTRLTSDVVTGKLDVREAARRLPEDSTESSGRFHGIDDEFMDEDEDEDEDEAMEEPDLEAADDLETRG